MIVKILNYQDKKNNIKWNNFVFSCPSATFFHRAEWQKIIKHNFGHDTYFIYTELGPEITGILPLVHVKSRIFGNSLISIPFGVYGGVATTSSVAMSVLSEEGNCLAARLGVELLEYRNVSPQNLNWTSQRLYYTFRKKLFQDHSRNLSDIPRKQRAMVRKGIASGLSSEVDRDVDSFYILYLDNMHRHGTPPLPKKYFRSLLEAFGSDCDILSVTDSQGQVVSTVLSFYFRNEILPYYAGDSVHARYTAANDFKYWELMRHAVERGISVFDFGRSKVDTGSFKFKKNWGFEPQQLQYEYCFLEKNSVPQNNPSNKKFEMLIRIWRLLPSKMVTFIGPHIVKNLS